jgi:hypothetical protein
MPSCLYQTTPLTLEWIRSLSTLAAVVAALSIALFGDWMKRLFFKPKLELQALVQRPDAEKVGRQKQIRHPLDATAFLYKQIGEAWFFRLAISNLRGTPAREVQVYLRQVEKLDGTTVSRFTPMNLRWTHTGETTRKVLLNCSTTYRSFATSFTSAIRHRRARLEKTLTESRKTKPLCVST